MRGQFAIRCIQRVIVGFGMSLAWVACSAGDPSLEPVQLGRGDLDYEIEYATYFGGRGDERAREVIVYADGSILLGMQTTSKGLPTLAGSFQRKYAGDDVNGRHPWVYGGDLYLVRLGPKGRRLLATTYFGGSKQERNTYGMALDAKQNVVIASSTRSKDIPTTPRAPQRRFGGGDTDWFVAKLSPDLKELRWSTYLGGRGDDTPRGGLDIDPSGRIVVAGSTASQNFPGLRKGKGPVVRHKGGSDQGAAVVWLSSGGKLQRTVAIPGRKTGVVVGVRTNEAGEVYVAGHGDSDDMPVTPNAAQPQHGGHHDNFVMKFSPQGDLLYSTYQGGSGNEFAEHRLALGPDGTVYLAGATASEDFPATAGAYQTALVGRPEGFLFALAPDGTKFRWATYLGGTGEDVFLMPTLDSVGRVFTVGRTASPDFPVSENALQQKLAPGPTDGALSVFSPDGSRIVYSTFLGGSGDDWIRSLAFGPKGEVYLIGRTDSKDFPVTAGAFQRENAGGFDAFVVKLVPTKHASGSSDG